VRPASWQGGRSAARELEDRDDCVASIWCDGEEYGRQKSKRIVQLVEDEIRSNAGPRNASKGIKPLDSA
jgi:hypothetical protein